MKESFVLDDGKSVLLVKYELMSFLAALNKNLVTCYMVRV